MTHHHDRPSPLVAQPLHHLQIGLPPVLLQAIIEPNLGPNVREQRLVLREPGTREQDVGRLGDGVRGEEDGEDEIQSLAYAVCLLVSPLPFPVPRPPDPDSPERPIRYRIAPCPIFGGSRARPVGPRRCPRLRGSRLLSHYRAPPASPRPHLAERDAVGRTSGLPIRG
jgi:hypothetical protein